MHVLSMDVGSSRRSHARQVPPVDDVKTRFTCTHRRRGWICRQAKLPNHTAAVSAGPLDSLARTCDSQPASILIAFTKLAASDLSPTPTPVHLRSEITYTIVELRYSHSLRLPPSPNERRPAHLSDLLTTSVAITTTHNRPSSKASALSAASGAFALNNIPR